MTKIIELCGRNDCCPRVEIDEHEVRIGEEGNLVRLTSEEWSVLRRKILEREL